MAAAEFWCGQFIEPAWSSTYLDGAVHTKTDETENQRLFGPNGLQLCMTKRAFSGVSATPLPRRLSHPPSKPPVSKTDRMSRTEERLLSAHTLIFLLLSLTFFHLQLWFFSNVNSVPLRVGSCPSVWSSGEKKGTKLRTKSGTKVLNYSSFTA